jgi:hypothetical protein
MRKSSPVFFSWYQEEAALPIAATALTLKLVNSNGQALQISRIVRGNSIYFQRVKQHIWDIFWASSNGESDYLSIYVTESDNVPRHGASSQITDGMGRKASAVLTSPHRASHMGRSQTTPESNIYGLLN